ncbi:MAG: UDP-3-O-acyl-N-acetylglucosamine deacetylase [Armatimonadetes bacterium]|nr:UDP-3-O-acyl-N-acetylglucosamine deacetylase [Armatimonadota bacterium]
MWVSDGDRHVIAVPADGLTVAAGVDYGREHGRAQAYAYAFDRPPTPHLVSLVTTSVGGPAEELAAALHAPAGAIVPEDPEPPFVRELAPARTFCFADWIPAIQAAGLGGGGSLANTIVLFDEGPSTPLRFANELARHKALDLLGDLALVGGRLNACVVAIKAGHALHLAAAEQIRRQADVEG